MGSNTLPHPAPDSAAPPAMAELRLPVEAMAGARPFSGRRRRPESDVALICGADCVCDWLPGRPGRRPVEDGSQARGGAELQVGLLARGLAERKTSMALILPEGSELPVQGWPEGVRAVRMAGKQPGRLRGALLRWPARHWAALSQANARVYYQRAMHPWLLATVLFCRATGRRFIYGVACEADVDGTWATMYGMNPRLNRLIDLAIRHADGVVAQTEAQADIIRRRFGRTAPVIANIAAPLQAQSRTPGDGVAWIGRAFPDKRPDLLLALAQALPEVCFHVVMQRRGGRWEREDEMLDGARRLQNARLLDCVPAWRVAELYDGVGLLLNTSDKEGFPNTFLDAWQLGLPVVTRYDPGGLVAREGLGWVADGVPALASALREAVRHPAERAARGRRGQDYVAANHGYAAVVDKYLHAFGVRAA